MPNARRTFERPVVSAGGRNVTGATGHSRRYISWLRRPASPSLATVTRAIAHGLLSQAQAASKEQLHSRTPSWGPDARRRPLRRSVGFGRRPAPSTHPDPRFFPYVPGVRTLKVRFPAFALRRFGDGPPPERTKAGAQRTHGGDSDSDQLPDAAQLREDPPDPRSAQPDRHPEAFLRQVPPVEHAVRRPAGLRASGRLQERVPDSGLQRDLGARLRLVHARAAEVRRGRVPPARHDLRGADQGHDPADHLRHVRLGREVHSRHQGAGGLLR